MDFLMKNMGILALETLLQEFTDKRKATKNHLSCIEGKYLWDKATNRDKEASLGLHANINIAKSVFRGLTEMITKSSMISLAYVKAIS